MKAFYARISHDELYPIFCGSFDEAKDFCSEHHRAIIFTRETINPVCIESDERVFMSPKTGSVDFESAWGAEFIEDGLCVEVRYDSESEEWVPL